ncbi:hypothetical protein [Bradyrhizobium sp. BR 1432]
MLLQRFLPQRVKAIGFAAVERQRKTCADYAQDDSDTEQAFSLRPE